jgi:hypothetical protein
MMVGNPVLVGEFCKEVVADDVAVYSALRP